MIARLASARELAQTAARRFASRRDAGYIGWAGHGNLGDDVMFAAAEQLLGKRLETLSGPSVERWLEPVGLSGPGRFDRTYLGGGTLINRNYLPIIEHCVDRRMPLASLGTGVGSAGFSMAEEGVDPRWIDALRRFDAVGVRGPVSHEKLTRAGLSSAEIVGDLALALTPPQPLGDFRARRFIVNCAPASAAADAAPMERAETALALAIRELATAGWEPLPVAFDRADVAPLRRLMDNAGCAGLAIGVPSRFAEYRSIAARTAFSVGVRLHSAVLAAACGVTPVLIGYRDKCRDFAASIDRERMVVPLETIDADRLLAAVGEAIEGGEALGCALHDRCATSRDRLAEFAVRLAAHD